MSEESWYYVDADRKQNGPVTAEFIRNARRGGSIADTTLVWCEGMAEWLPVRQAAGRLGLSSIATPPVVGNGPNGDTPFGYQPPPRADTLRANQDVVPAGFFRRWAALFLDSLILCIPLIIVAAVVAMPLGIFNSERESAGAMVQVIYYLLYFIVAPLYFAGMESSARQATLGKQALGIKVTDNDGRQLSFAHALGRWAAASLSYLTLYIGFLMAAFTERKRALHDMIAGTLVVDRWAYTDHPENQKRGFSGCLVVFAIVVVCVPIVGILAAIGVAQFEDYGVRAQVQEAVLLANGAKTAVTEYRANSARLPVNNAEAGLAAPASISGQYVSQVNVGSVPGEITATFSSTPPQHADPKLDGASIVFSPTDNQGSIEWRCHSETIKKKLCPRICDCQ